MGNMAAVELVEHIYDCRLPEMEWLAGIGTRMAPFLPPTLGSVAYRFTVGETFSLGDDVVVNGGTDEWAALPKQFAMHAPREVVLDAYCATAPVLATEAYSAELWASLVPPEIPDGLALIAHDPAGHQVSGAICFYPLAEKGNPSRQQRYFGKQVFSHVGAALRLRHRLAERTTLLESAAGILDERGRVSQATGHFASRDGQEELRQMARRVDSAKVASIRDADPHAMDPWTALVSGRWSMVDQFDTDGRRYFVVVENAPVVADPRALSDRERHALAYAAVGYSNNAIAYHLGLEEATVSRVTRSGMAKLGLATRQELVKGFARLAPETPNHGDGGNTTTARMNDDE